MKNFIRFYQALFLVLFTSGLFAQAVPEYMYYKFNAAGNQQNFASAPVGTNPAVLTGLTIGGTGQFGTALQGNGGSSSTNRLSTGWATNLPSTGWTISLWLNGLVSNTTLYYLFGDPGALSFRCFLGGAAGAGNLLFRGGGLTDVTATAVAPGPTVVHFVYTGTSIKWYKNGVLSGTVAQPTVTVSGAGPFLIGGYSTSVGMNAGSLLDEWRMYNRPLSDAEVLSTWNQPLPLGAAMGTLEGTVTNSYNGLPVPGVTVTVTGYPPQITNAAGFYSVPNITPGNVTINATATGYQPYTGTATIVAYQTTVKNFVMTPVSVFLQGYITNASTGAPVNGAKISVGSTFGYSNPLGYYNFQAFPSGSQTVTVSKAGFVDNATIVNILVPGPTSYNAALQVTAYPPGPVTATLNTAATAVDINWSPPSGLYEIIYDDGGRENWTVWATAGNMNAVKFTPISGGVSIISGKVNIGDAVNYAAGTDPTLLAPFQIAVFDATGTAGAPGAQIGAPIDVIPTSFGWNTFTFPTPVSVTGTFYLVMIQGGTPPNAAGLAVDETTNNLRSYSRFITGGGPWLPASGNYMIRAVVSGQGGPLDIDAMAQKTVITANPIEGLIYDHTPVSFTGLEGNADYVPTVIPYTVWRLLEGQESNEALWGAPIASNITGTSTVDNGWPSLPCGPYRWAVKAGYPVNRLSTPVFSNVIGKCWTVSVTVNVALTCSVSPVAGTIVKLQNTSFSQYMYTGTLTSTGTVTFPAVWKGTYDLTVSKIGYDPYLLPAQLIMDNKTFDVILLQQKLAPSNMFVDNKSLVAIWNAPVGLAYPLLEEWASGNFTTNQWVSTGNWSVTTGFGNPAPSAQFYWSPTLTNYDRPLTSKTLTGTGSPDQKLLYDIYLSNFSTATLEEFAVEYQVGGAGPWILLKHYDNTGGSIPWTSETLNIASIGSQTYKIRFRAYGANSFNINNWNIDNIKVRSIAPDPKPCILAYNVYLNGVLDGVTLDTTYQIPPSHVLYNQVYNACVKAVYGSGYSGQSCYTFTSKFLYPPIDLEVEAVECAAYLTWEKPGTKKILSMTPRTNFPNAASEYSPNIYTMSDNGNNSDALWDVLFTYPTIPASGAGGGQVGIEVEGAFMYTSVWGGVNTGPPWFAKYDMATGALVEAFNIAGATAIRDLAYDGTYFYGSPASTVIYKMDFTTKTLIGTIPGGGTVRHIAYDPVNNGFWCGDWTTMRLIDATTGALIANGPAPVSAYGSAYDPDPAGPFLWVHQQNGSPADEVVQYLITGTTLTATGITHNMGTLPGFPAGASIAGGLCAADFGTKFALIGIVQSGTTGIANLMFGVELRAGGGGPPGGAGLLGYKIYRDGAVMDTVMDPDTLFYYDFTVNPGTHEYAVAAWYELTPYGYPGQYDDSMLEGPVEIDIMCGRELPFYEPWTQGSFTFNDWTLSNAANTNWSVSASTGNPAPAADFSWVPIQYDYSLSLQSPVLNGGPFTCAMIWCDFDYKLDDRNSTGAEKLYVDVFTKGVWKKAAEFANTASKDWTPMHIDISGAKGKAFMVRFRAEGANSADILHWYVDNVHIYAKCNPPVELDVASIDDLEVTLSWSKPICGSEGPDPIWIHWDDGTNADAIGTGGAADFDIAARWDASQIVALDGGAVTKIAFYPASSGSAAYKLRVWQGPDAATLLVDQAVPTVTTDEWNIVDVASPVPIDISQELWIGLNVNATSGYPAGCDPGPAVTGYGDMIYFGGVWDAMSTAYGLDYNWNMQGYIEGADDHATTNKVIPLVQNTNLKSVGTLAASGLPSLNTRKFNPAPESVTEGRALLGYNVYRSDDGRVTYNKRNANLVTDTTYMDVIPDHLNYYYYVTSVFPSYGTALCESDSSNVVGVLTLGIDQLNGGKISVYPNPATDNVFVKSDFTITNIEVLNYIGQTVYTRQNVSEKSIKVNVANFTPGVYFVKVTTTEGIRTVKITVTR